MTISIAVASGKGGVGKTSIAVNLSLTLSRLGSRVVLFDADFGLANSHILLGVNPKKTAQDILVSKSEVKDVLAPGPLGLKFLSGGSGFTELLNLEVKARYELIGTLDVIQENTDILVVDVPAGASDSSITFSSAVDKLVLILVGEPTSFMDAYTFIKAANLEAGVENQTVITTSFSKVTFGGGGISFLATAGHSLDLIKKVRTTMIICPDKLNQKRHVEFFKDVKSVHEHMKKHADLVRPKFELAYSFLEALPVECGTFSRPTGGYFITYSTSKPIATRVVALCKELGVLITPAGSTFPKNYDPNDSVIRLAPTFVEASDLSDAMDVFATAVLVAHYELEI